MEKKLVQQILELAMSDMFIALQLRAHIEGSAPEKVCLCNFCARAHTSVRKKGHLGQCPKRPNITGPCCAYVLNRAACDFPFDVVIKKMVAH